MGITVFKNEDNFLHLIDLYYRTYEKKYNRYLGHY